MRRPAHCLWRDYSDTRQLDADPEPEVCRSVASRGPAIQPPFRADNDLQPAADNHRTLEVPSADVHRPAHACILLRGQANIQPTRFDYRRHERAETKLALEIATPSPHFARSRQKESVLLSSGQLSCVELALPAAHGGRERDAASI